MKNDIVTQYGSFAHGAYTTASGQASHAEGVGTVANHLAQHSLGAYNVPDSSTATDDERGEFIQIVGNGTQTSCSNARTLDWNGNEKIAGNLTINAGTENEVTITPELLNSAGNSSGEGVSNLEYVKDSHEYEEELLMTIIPIALETNLENNQDPLSIDPITETDLKNNQGPFYVLNLSKSEFNFIINTIKQMSNEDNQIIARLQANTENQFSSFSLLGKIKIVQSVENNDTIVFSLLSMGSGSALLELRVNDNEIIEITGLSNLYHWFNYLKAPSNSSDATICIYKINNENNFLNNINAVVINDIVKNIASGNFSYAEGTETNAINFASHAEGRGTIASGMGSHAEGGGTIASGVVSHAEGRLALASGAVSHAEGTNTMASGKNSHVEGDYTIAFGEASHAEGWQTTAAGEASHAEGCATTASGAQSHAEGIETTASGEFSHAEGEQTTASGACSHAEGVNTIANHLAQHVFGQYNIEDSSERGTYIEIVGNGNSAASRSNARMLDWEGNEYLQRSLILGAGTTSEVRLTPQRLKDLLALLPSQEIPPQVIK